MNPDLNTIAILALLMAPMAANSSQSNLDERSLSAPDEVSEQAPKRQKVENKESDSSLSSQEAALAEEELYFQAISNTGNDEGAKAFERAAREGRVGAVRDILAFMDTHPGEATLLLARANTQYLNPLISAAIFGQLDVLEALLAFALDYPQWREDILTPEDGYNAFDMAVLDSADFYQSNDDERDPEVIIQMVRVFLRYAGTDPAMARLILNTASVGPFNNLIRNEEIPDSILAEGLRLFFDYIAAHPDDGARLLEPVMGDSALYVATLYENRLTIATILDFAQREPALATRLFDAGPDDESALQAAVVQGDEHITSMFLRSPLAYLFFTTPTAFANLANALLNQPSIDEQLLRVFIVNVPHFFAAPLFQLILQREGSRCFAIPLATEAQNVGEVMRLIDAGYDFDDDVLIQILENSQQLSVDYRNVANELSRNLEFARHIGRPAGFDADKEARLKRIIEILRRHSGTVPRLRELSERAIRNDMEFPRPPDLLAGTNGEGRSPYGQRIQRMLEHQMLQLGQTHEFFVGHARTFFARTFAAFIKALQFHVDHKNR